MHKAAYTNKAVSFAEDIVSEQLAEKYRRSLEDDKKKKRRKRKRINFETKDILKKRPKWWINLNKGLLVEFLIFVISQGFNFFTNIWVLLQVTGILNKVDFYQTFPNVTRLNFTVAGSICKGKTWNREQINKHVDHYQNITYVYCLFIALTTLLVTLQTFSWLYTLYLSMEKKEIGEKAREVLIKMKLGFLLGGSFLEDIPLSAITAELFAIQQGSTGITCWLCRVTGECTSQKVLDALFDASQQVLILNVCAISVTSLWKGISSFYRWSRIPNFEMFYIRAATSLFAGTLFVIVILTPAMTVLSFRYYNKPGVQATLVKAIIDRIYIIGVIFWIMVLAVICCCPLLSLIRVSNK